MFERERERERESIDVLTYILFREKYLLYNDKIDNEWIKSNEGKKYLIYLLMEFDSIECFFE